MVVQMALKDIHVGGKLIDSYYRGKKFSTHEKFTKGTSNKDTMFVLAKELSMFYCALEMFCPLVFNHNQNVT